MAQSDGFTVDLAKPDRLLVQHIPCIKGIE